MTERTMDERDAERAEGFYWILCGVDARGPVWEVALWDSSRRFYGAGWHLAGVEEDLTANLVLEVNERRLEPPTLE
jgi:hypothetical protein